MKIFILSFFLSLGLVNCSNSFAQDTIQWRIDDKLKWEDFQGNPDTTSEYKAITAAEVKYILSYTVSSFTVKVTCAFDKRKSWTSSSDSVGLAHEQGHFDIAEIFARKLRKAFKEYIFNPNTIEAEFKKIFSSIKAERKAFNDLYDKETNFSRNKTKQGYWNKKILTEVKKLEVYKYSPI